MNVIYQPKGAAAEYADLAANLYRGCSHACTYCYAPATIRLAAKEFYAAKPRKDVLKALAKDTDEYAGTQKRVLMSFTTDPYQPLERVECLTRDAIEMMGDRAIPINILTKNPLFAIDRDWSLFAAYDVHFGTSISFTDDDTRQQWEPGAAPIADRFKAMEAAHGLGVPTWLSIEPVIDPAQALGVIMNTTAYIDHYKVGKLNHNKAIEERVDWRQFLSEALRVLTEAGSSYRIKDDLWRYADREIIQQWPQKSTPKPTKKTPGEKK